MRNKLVISLEELLTQHDCVSVPGLGAFIQEHIPASWDAEHRLAYPPCVALRFNEALQHQDGLLMEYYATTLGISQRRAKLELEQDIRQLRQLLLRQQYADLQGIGTLRLSPEGRLSFSSKVSEKINYRYYGLQAVISPMQTYQSGAKVQSDVANTEQDYIQINIPKSILRYAAAVAVVAFLLALPFSIWPERSDSYQASFVPDKANVSKLISPITEGVRPEVAEEEVTPPSNIIEVQPGTYYVIIGSERREEIALRYIERYQSEFPKISILKGRSILRISAANYATAQEAQSFVNELNKRGISAWVYHL